MTLYVGVLITLIVARTMSFITSFIYGMHMHFIFTVYSRHIYIRICVISNIPKFFKNQVSHSCWLYAYGISNLESITKSIS